MKPLDCSGLTSIVFSLLLNSNDSLLLHGPTTVFDVRKVVLSARRALSLPAKTHISCVVVLSLVKPLSLSWSLCSSRHDLSGIKPTAVIVILVGIHGSMLECGIRTYHNLF